MGTPTSYSISLGKVLTEAVTTASSKVCGRLRSLTTTPCSRVKAAPLDTAGVASVVGRRNSIGTVGLAT